MNGFYLKTQNWGLTHFIIIRDYKMCKIFPYCNSLAILFIHSYVTDIVYRQNKMNKRLTTN